MDNMYKYRMVLRIQSEPSFANVFKIDVTEPLIKDLSNICNPKHQFRSNTIINISGSSGSGKSKTTISLGKQIFPNFSEKNVFFFDQEILDNAKKFPPDTLLIRDENPSKATFGMGSIRVRTQVGLMAETCRKAGLNLAFIEPSFVQDSISKLYLETVDMDINNRITRLAVRDTHSLKYIGAMYIKVIDDNDPISIKYEKRKDAFIESIKDGTHKGAKADYESMAKGILEEIDLDIYSKPKERKAFIISKYPTLTTSEHDLILTLMNIQIKKEESKDNIEFSKQLKKVKDKNVERQRKEE